MPSIDETLELARGPSGHDSIVAEDDEAVVVHGCLYIKGSITDARSDDLLIVPTPTSWLLFWRDPEGAEALWGREWCGGHAHEDWSALVTQVYEL